MLRIMIFDNNQNRSEPLIKSLLESGLDVVAQVKDEVDLQTKCGELLPDAVLIDTESPSRGVLENVHMVTRENEKPVVMFSQDSEKEALKAATKAGVSAYVVGKIASERISPVIEAAIARFEETKQLREDLQKANTKLDERKLIERAKGILMQQRDLDEDSAYKMLRSMAMKKNMKLADLSSQLINTAKMLII